MMNVNKKECKVHNKFNNNSVKCLKPLCSMECVAAFYSSRFITEAKPGDGESYALELDRVSQDIDWSIALSLIKYEGIYCFGGRDKDNIASNRLFCIQVDKCKFSNSAAAAGEPDLNVLRLEPSGTPPPPRYMHSMTYFHDRSLITIAGGRND